MAENQTGDHPNSFQAAMAKAGLQIENPIVDGKIHRFDIENRDKAGWYVLFGGDVSVGIAGNWKTGQ
ncbi:hypothetical protein KA005_08055, partial [bacterium]|nr:hypothetical protein [bacterium]